MNFKKGLLISLSVHTLIVVCMTLRFIFSAPQVLDISQAVRVDMIALPDKQTENILPEKVQNILKEKESPTEPIETKQQPEPILKTKEILPEKKVVPQKTAIDLKKTKQKQKTALDKLKTLSAIDKIKQDVKNEADKKMEIKNLPLKGRVLSAGTKITGLDKIQSDNYLSQLDAKIKAQWTMPQWMIGKPFRASVWVKINPDGTLASKKISKSSGNPTYDEYCLAAVDKALPFPAVPAKFGEVFKIDGVSFVFPD